MLAHWFLDRYARGANAQITSASMKCLLQYDWPGNVRELENCVERAVTLGNGKIINLNDLPPAIFSSSPVVEDVPAPLQGPVSATDLEEIERATIQRVFQQVRGDKVVAGKMLGISRATLYRKLKRYNISPRMAMPTPRPGL
jgi:DNA-binding NtrC family response regulator